MQLTIFGQHHCQSWQCSNFLRNCEIEKWNSRVMIGPFHNSDIRGKNGTQTIPRCFLCDLFFFLELVTKSIVFAPKWLYKCITFSILWPCFQSFLCLTEVRMIYMGDMPHLTTCVNTVHWSSNHYLKVESEFWSIFKVVLIYIVG